MHLGGLLRDYGYVIVASFIFLEGIAIPLPTDTTLVTAAAFAAHGRLSLAVVFLVATLATTLGTTVAFVAGRRGSALLDRHSRSVNPAMLERTRALFDRHGGAAVAVGRFLPVVRMLISPVAGLSSMSLRRFTVFNVIGAAVWAAVFCGIGWFFGQHPPAFGRGLVRVALVVTLCVALLVTVAVAGGWLVEESDAAWRAEGTIWHRILTSAPLRWLASHSPRLQAFLFRRFTPGDYLGLNVTLGLGTSFVAVVIFGALMKSLLATERLPHLDVALAASLREGVSPGTEAVWHALSRLGAPSVILVAGLLVALPLVPRRGWLPLAGFAAAMAGSALLDALVERLLAHAPSAPARPLAVLGAGSGAALTLVVGYGMLAYLIVLYRPGRRLATVVIAGSLLLVLAICIAWLCLGARWFSDVVIGLAAGCVWVSACITGLEVARRRGERDPR